MMQTTVPGSRYHGPGLECGLFRRAGLSCRKSFMSSGNGQVALEKLHEIVYDYVDFSTPCTTHLALLHSLPEHQEFSTNYVDIAVTPQQEEQCGNVNDGQSCY